MHLVTMEVYTIIQRRYWLCDHAVGLKIILYCHNMRMACI